MYISNELPGEAAAIAADPENHCLREKDQIEPC